MVRLVKAGNCAGGAYGSIGGKKGRGLWGPFGVGLFLGSCWEAQEPAGWKLQMGADAWR